jgi:hypothetical protein
MRVNAGPLPSGLPRPVVYRVVAKNPVALIPEDSVNDHPSESGHIDRRDIPVAMSLPGAEAGQAVEWAAQRRLERAALHLANPDRRLDRSQDRSNHTAETWNQ